MSYSEDLQRRNICISVCVVVLVVVLSSKVLIQPANGYLDIKQYCRAFDENFQPIICILKNKTNGPPANYHPPQPQPHPHPHPEQPPPSTSPRPPPPPTQFPILLPHPDYNDYDDDDDDDDCSCEVTCVPRIIHQRSFVDKSQYLFGKRRDKRTTSTSYRCRSCGTECSVSTTRPPSCYCAIPASKSECTCSATCAMFRDDRQYHFQNDNGDGDANCIMSVTALEDWRLGEERPPYVCECKRSKEAENSRRPDFICICQRIPIFRDFRGHGSDKKKGK